ncbi:hypothetical protein BX666DRAFT_1851833 [Dichotomocladium elegans]|nr:hypothetical protein BX666DRAFT_1851833 [Dichotomocladium elegans]
MASASFRSFDYYEDRGSSTSYWPSPSSYSTLAEYLRQTPFIFNYRFDDTTCKTILTYCYESLWQQNSTDMEQFFFHSQKELQDAIQRQLSRINSKDQGGDVAAAVIPDLLVRSDEPLIWHANAIAPAIDLSSERGRQCGHVFRKGEPVYRCRKVPSGALDPGSGGCCDCGDAEAWKITLDCKIHTDQPVNENFSTSQVPPRVIDNIRASIAATLDFVLNTFTLAPEEIALSSLANGLGGNKSDSRNPQNEDEDMDMDKENSENIFTNNLHPQADQHMSDTQSANDEEYMCLAWNDEGHAFSHVLESIMTATGCKWDRAKEMVDSIHAHGREVIAVSRNVDELKKIAAPLAAINLGVTIRRARDVYREKICTLLVYWLKELIHGPSRFFTDIPNGDKIIRSIVCEELCAEWEMRNSSTALTTPPLQRELAQRDTDEEGDLGSDSAMGKDMDGDVEMHDIGIIDWDPSIMIEEFQTLRNEENQAWDTITANLNGKRKNLDLEPVDDMKTGVGATTSLASEVQHEFKKKLRLDYFMLYDLKLWKEMRIALRELYISSLASDTKFKKILGKRLARNYARLAESFLLKDREPEISIILFSVQLLTVPSVADLLVNRYEFFGLVCCALTAFFLTDHLYLLLPSERARSPSRINCESRAFRTRRYFNAFHDLRYIMNVDMIKLILVQDPLYLRQFLDLISMFQSMNAQVCQKDTHVEYESEIWVNAFNVTLQIAKCCRQFSDCFAKLPKSSRQEHLASAKILIRSITRVLGSIQNWDTSPDDMRTVVDDTSQSRQTRPSTQQPGVAGVKSQMYHTFDLPYIDQPLEVVQYDILSQPVSFHHPLHWLLACLLEHAYLLDDQTIEAAGYTGGFSQVITLFKLNSAEQYISTDALLPILDFPVRTLAFSAQIRAGVWVRNGYGIRNQAHHYRDISLRENTYDADIFLLQLGFATVNPEKLMMTLMDRFGLFEWFNGERDHPQYDTSQTTFMVEEFLNLLIICACEHANMSGMSIEARVRREIIHNLCLGSITYSELVKRIPERLHEHTSFDRILAEVGNFKAPLGVNDSGSYSLKEDYYDQIDPYFYHYSRNNREEAIAVLKDRWMKQNPTGNFFLLPRVSTLSDGPFRYIGEFLHSALFTQMAAYTLWNIRMIGNHKSDTNLDQTLYLIMLALTDKNNRQTKSDAEKSGGFFDYICGHYFPVTSETHSQELSLLDILSIFRDDEEKYKEIQAQLDWIFDRLVSDGPGRTRRAVNGWRAGRKCNKSKEEDNSASSELQKKKEAALARQKRIMAQFAQAQTQFMEKNEGLYEDDEDEEEMDQENETLKHSSDGDSESRFCPYPSGTCIVCQEDVSEKSESYGMLGLIQTSNILRESPPIHDPAVQAQICAIDGSLDVEWPDAQEAPDDATTLPGYPASLHKTGLYASTCGHLMHIKCFEVYCSSIDSRHASQLTRNQPENRTRNEFMCPLCKSLGNVLLPIYWKGRKEEFPGIIESHKGNFAYSSLQSSVQMGMERLRQAVINRSQRRRSGGSKLKEAINAYFVPYLRSAAVPDSGSYYADDWSNFGNSLLGSDISSGNQDSLGLPEITFGETRIAPFESDILHSSASSNISSISQMYTRLFDVTSIIHQELCNDESIREMSTNTKNIDLLWGLLGYTITSLEIAVRGAKRREEQPDDTHTLFDQIPAQMRLLLRILCDSIAGYTTIVCQPRSAITTSTGAMPSQIRSRMHLLALSRLRQVFPDIPVRDLTEMPIVGRVYANPPLLQDDPFMILCELSFHGTTFTKIDVHAMVRVLFLAELTKTVTAIVSDQLKANQNSSHTVEAVESKELSFAIKKFCYAVMHYLRFTVREALRVYQTIGPNKLYTLIRAFGLPFLRRTIVLLISRYGYIPKGRVVMDPDTTSEFDRLLNVLWLPNLEEFLQLSQQDEQLVKGWCEQHVAESERAIQMQELPLSSRLLDIVLDMPAPLYLLPLPRRFEKLIDESMRRICTKCGTVPTDPSVCLLCGTFVCTQSFCCADDEEGECNLHNLECGGEIGIYLSIKRCVLILLHNGNGWFLNAPYLDAHGEVDQGLRRGRPQYLNLKRYAEIRKLWLQHNIPVYIARQIEANFDVGGWTTL